MGGPRAKWISLGGGFAARSSLVQDGYGCSLDRVFFRCSIAVKTREWLTGLVMERKER